VHEPRTAGAATAGQSRTAGAATAGQSRIVVAGVTKQYGGRTVVDNLSFTAEPGRVTGFLGPNGAGKTTTLRMVLCLVAPTAGGATIGGHRYADLADPIHTVGAVLESSAAHANRTGRDHLRVLCTASGVPEKRVDEVLELVGMVEPGRRRFREYSLGMRQRLGIAQAMLGDPKVLILDEPANGLDPEGIRWMRDLLRMLAAEGRTILVSSHLLAQMEQLADDVVIIAGGRLVSQGTLAEVTGARQPRVRVRTPQHEALAEALLRAGADVSTDGDVLRVTGRDALAVGATARELGIEVHELVTERADLEDVFLTLTQGPRS
jgi:ABC-2 type transport system ATP-binding protein